MTDRHITRPPYCIDRKAPSKEQLNGQNCLRVYNYAPGLVMLQIRGTNSYHSVTLTREHIEMLRDMLDAAVLDMCPAMASAELLEVVSK